MFLRELLVVAVICLAMVVSEPPVLASQYGPPGLIPGTPLQQPPLNGIGGQQLPPPAGDNFGAGGPNYNYEGSNIGGQDHHDHSQGMAYEFGYQVKDDYSGNNYGRREKSDGNQVRGEYSVHLPDGRIQIVSYYADWQTGFHADVRYEGQATYPGPNNGNGIPNQYGEPRIENQGGFADGPREIPPGGPGIDVGQGSFIGVPDSTRYGAPRIDVGQGGFGEIPGSNRFDSRTPGGGYDYNNNGGGRITGYAPVNDGIDFDDSYRNYNYNRNKPVKVYGAP